MAVQTRLFPILSEETALFNLSLKNIPIWKSDLFLLRVLFNVSWF